MVSNAINLSKKHATLWHTIRRYLIFLIFIRLVFGKTDVLDGEKSKQVDTSYPVGFPLFPECNIEIVSKQSEHSGNVQKALQARSSPHVELRQHIDHKKGKEGGEDHSHGTGTGIVDQLPKGEIPPAQTEVNPG